LIKQNRKSPCGQVYSFHFPVSLLGGKEGQGLLKGGKMTEIQFDELMKLLLEIVRLLKEIEYFVRTKK